MPLAEPEVQAGKPPLGGTAVLAWMVNIGLPRKQLPHPKGVAHGDRVANKEHPRQPRDIVHLP